MNHKEDEQVSLNIAIHHHGKEVTITLPESSKLTDLSHYVARTMSIPVSSQKFIITPKIGLLKPPFAVDYAVSSLSGRKIVLIGSTTSEVSQLQESITRSSGQASSRSSSSSIKPAIPARIRDFQRSRDDAMYTFHTIEPLSYLPNSKKSYDLLVRLRDDTGIKAAMRKFRFTVGLLTEMDPATNTGHDGKTLGLNRNKGQVIELRLRTDAYDGYRDYKTIRKTLCHELAHNVHSDHDRNFHNLWNEIEKLVNREDWSRNGNRLSNQVYYEPRPGDMDHFDDGGWTGGEFVLGSTPGSICSATSLGGLSQREIIARAAEDRQHLIKHKSLESNKESTHKDT